MRRYKTYKYILGEMVKQEEERKSQEIAEAATPVVKKSLKWIGISKRLTGLGVNMQHGVSNKLEAKPSPKKILSHQQKNIFEGDSHKESCSWARKVVDVTISLGLGLYMVCS